MSARSLATGLALVASLLCARAHSAPGPNTPHDGQTAYFWKTEPAGATAQLVTLFCRNCTGSPQDVSELPLISVLRDTLGDGDADDDRLTAVWLLSYQRPALLQRALSAVPFFYWRVGQGSADVKPQGMAPLLDLTTLQAPVMSEIKSDVLQWAILDPAATPFRATSRAYRSNETDHERVHLEEAISYLQSAPLSNGSDGLTRQQLGTIIVRLELRKKLLGGFVAEREAAKLGEEEKFNDERIRSRNWELLRQCAEKTGLYFESLNLGGTSGQYGMLWFPAEESSEPTGIKLRSVWKLLNVKNPWHDERLKAPTTVTYTREVNSAGALLPPGTHGVRQVKILPLSVYNLNYPKMPLLLVDFRDGMHLRWHEMTQRSINEITSGVIGISHFTNWYYYAGADLYDFIVSRHGAAMDQSERLDCYAQFRVQLALDRDLDPALRDEMQQRANSLGVNPLETSPLKEMKAATLRYAQLQSEAENGGRLLDRLDKNRRAELAVNQESHRRAVLESVLHEMSFGAYTRRVKPDSENLALLDRYRRLQFHLGFLDQLADSGTQPEVQYDASRIQQSVKEVADLMSGVKSREARAHAAATLDRLRALSKDGELQADCSVAVASIRTGRSASGTEVAAKPAVIRTPPRTPAALDGVDGLK